MWPFRNRKPRHSGPQSVDWGPGDVAECIANNWDHVAPCRTPQVGDRLIVSRVKYVLDISGRYKGFGLWFAGYSLRYGFDCTAFRKIVDVGVEEPRRKVVKLPDLMDA